MKTEIALIQMVSSQHLDKNLARADQLIEQAASMAKTIFLPENFAALANENPREIGAREASESGEIRSFLSRSAARFECWIFGGTIPVSRRRDGSVITDNRVRAASFVYDNQGTEVARYDKIHMFDVEVDDNHKHYRESATFEPGNDVVLVDVPAGKVGLTVCYDLRFPELYRKLFSAGAEIFSIPSAFTEVTGAAHYEILMRARAIENLSYTVAACQGGQHDSGRRTWGHSMVVDPWGEVIARAGQGEDIITAEVNLDQVHRVRREMPVGEQRRDFS